MGEGRSLPGLLGEQLHRQPGEILRATGIQLMRCGRGVSRQAVQDCHDVLPVEGALAGEHDIQHATEAEQVGSMIDRQAACLFGSHESGRSHHHATLRQFAFGFVAEMPLRQTKIENFHPTPFALQPDVRGLDVAMNQPGFMSHRQAVGNFASNSQ